MNTIKELLRTSRGRADIGIFYAIDVFVPIKENLCQTYH